MEKNITDIMANHFWIIILILFWTLPWKAAALWRSARRAQLGWFLVMTVLNTLGILEILYIFFFSARHKEQPAQVASEFESKSNIPQCKVKVSNSRKVIL